MRALTFIFVFVIIYCSGQNICADVLENPEFETGDLTGWDTRTGSLIVGVVSNNTFNRNYAAGIYGEYAASAWVTSSISQTIEAAGGDGITASGFIYWPVQAGHGPASTGRVAVSLSGVFDTTSTVWDAVSEGWRYFELYGKIFGTVDGGFESGTLESWNSTCNDLTALAQTNEVDAGDYALKYEGSWDDGWSWNEVNQYVQLNSGDVVH
jgi:hypothetical protein